MHDKDETKTEGSAGGVSVERKVRPRRKPFDLVVTVAGHTARQSPHSDGWIVWDISPPVGGFAPCHTFILRDPGSDAERIQDITDAINKRILAGDDASIAAAQALMTTMGWA